MRRIKFFAIGLAAIVLWPIFADDVSARRSDHIFSEPSPWKETSCYKGIDFRTKSRTNTKGLMDVHLQLRSRYPQDLEISYAIILESEKNIPSYKQSWGRWELIAPRKMTPGSEGGYVRYNIQPGTRYTVHVNELSFGRHNSNYFPCDK